MQCIEYVASRGQAGCEGPMKRIAGSRGVHHLDPGRGDAPKTTGVQRQRPPSALGDDGRAAATCGQRAQRLARVSMAEARDELLGDDRVIHEGLPLQKGRPRVGEVSDDRNPALPRPLHLPQHVTRGAVQVGADRELAGRNAELHFFVALG